MDNEVCYYVYNKEKQEAEATTVKVEYETKCEEKTQKVCPEQQYGHQGYCKICMEFSEIISECLYMI